MLLQILYILFVYNNLMQCQPETGEYFATSIKSDDFALSHHSCEPEDGYWCISIMNGSQIGHIEYDAKISMFSSRTA